MNLDQAIKKIINDHGADILKDRRLVSMLSDLQAFGQLPYAANMLRQIYANGYGTKVHKLYCNKDQTEVAAFQTELRNKLGFDIEMLGKVLYAFSLPVQKGQKLNVSNSSQKQISFNDMEIIKFAGHKAYRDEFGGIYSSNAEIFYKLTDKNIPFYTLRDNTKIISGAAFQDCALMEIIIPNSAKFIGKSAFLGCCSLKQITIPNSVTSIGNSAFLACDSLQQITIPNSVTIIGDYTFYNCPSLQQICIPNSVTRISKEAFHFCSSLKQITIPNSVTSIEESAFGCCTSLQQITIPNSVTSIGSWAFSGCSSLERITIQKSTSIEECAIYNCHPSLKIIRY